MSSTPLFSVAIPDSRANFSEWHRGELGSDSRTVADRTSASSPRDGFTACPGVTTPFAALVQSSENPRDNNSPTSACPPSIARGKDRGVGPSGFAPYRCCAPRSEEHTSELQSRGHLVCRLLLE